MTKERKLEILKDLLIQLSDSANILCTCEADERCEVVEECINALEQQPCDDCENNDGECCRLLFEKSFNKDCVSRQKVKEGMIKYGFHAPDMTVTEFIEDELPPVTSKIPSSDDCVSLGVYKQVMWERDIAIEQLKELGYDFGEKIRTSDDFVSRADLLAQIKESWEAIETKTDFVNIVKASPSVTPTQCIAAIRFSKEDLKEICDERIEIACEHGTCMNCKHNRPNSYARTMFSCERGNRFKLRDCENFYCADFEKRGNENVSS